MNLEIDSVQGRARNLSSRLVRSSGSRLRSSYLTTVILPGWSFWNHLQIELRVLKERGETFQTYPDSLDQSDGVESAGEAEELR